MKYILHGNEIDLLPEKAMWMPESKTLVIADLHFGKVEHFRAAGIAIPAQANLQTLSALQNLLDRHHPSTVIFLGDLFHSVKNQSFMDVKSFLEMYPKVDFILVIGNHDIMKAHDYTELGLRLSDEWMLGNLWLTHEPQDEVRPNMYNLAGHIHPGVKLKGRARQSLTLPCFFFGEHNGILPAFGYFTGKAILKINHKSVIFAIAEDTIIPIPTQ